jgi:hypothetical protein
MAFESRYPNAQLSWQRKSSSAPDPERAPGTSKCWCGGGLLGTVVVDERHVREIGVYIGMVKGDGRSVLYPLADGARNTELWLV